MVGYGRVVGGDYLNAAVSTPIGSTVVVQAGFKFRKLVPENVAEWDEVVPDGKGNVVSAVGKAVAGAVIPGKLGKAASAAFGATIDSIGPTHVVDISWSDGKRSLIKLPDAMFKHLELVLRSQRAEPVEPAPGTDVAPPAVEKLTVTEQAFSLVSGIVRDRFPARPAQSLVSAKPTPQVQLDVTEQLTKLASLRDAGILTDEEFTAKKAELLARL
ncbi:SHOCT domain-containing protein [Herbiconiux sp. CPCC 205716]|uniref:SHOCT domain-containing protein n=1 Tax=Herbiconiux gentiana TaxID=2970912 RepID=A0ABT2GD18_9MICO|nr:SHOCT domain-containing protein [Herbiconiux gentiana]MCS5713190.1 SHOCT domain-containing protein [Herbiconiux gentiana]